MKKIVIPAFIIVVAVVLILAVVKLYPVMKEKDSGAGTSSDDGGFYESEEYTKIVNNREDITRVIRWNESEGEVIEEGMDIESSYNKIKNLKIIGKTDWRVLDGDSYYVFEFKDGSSVRIHFEERFLRYNGENYEVEWQK